ncbi:MAG: hypothetical protein DRN07_06680, partial [Thermoplasmata archaeon]
KNYGTVPALREDVHGATASLAPAFGGDDKYPKTAMQAPPQPQRAFSAKLSIYSGGGTVILPPEEFEGSFPPAGWTVIGNAWDRNDAWGRPNYAGGNGYCADAGAGAYGSACEGELITPAFSLVGTTAPTLSYIASYNYLSGDYADVDISTDGGSTWTNLLHWAEDHDAYGPGEEVSIDLSPYIGESNVMIRFHYYADSWDWWYEVDAVAIYDGDPPGLVHEETIPIPTLDVGEEYYAEFTPWYGAGGDYTAVVQTMHPDEMVPGNDMKMVNFTIEYVAMDVSVDSIDNPEDGGVYQAGEITVQSTVCNNGAIPATFDLNCSIYRIMEEPLERGDVFYAHNAYPGDDLIWFDSDDPGTFNVIGPNQGADFLPGGTWADGTWYVVEYGTGALYTVDPVTGTMTLIGSTGVDLTGIAYDDNTGTMYASGAYDLYTIDLSTATATYVGPFGTGGLMIDIACDNDGNLYGHDIGTDSIYSIDPSTGAATLIGSTGLAANYAQGMEYDKNNDILYLAAYDIYAGGGLYTVDLSTGAATLVGAFEGGAEVCALAIPYTTGPPQELVYFDEETVTDLPAGECTTVDFLPAWDAEPGEYRIVVTALVQDDNPENDEQEISVIILADETPPVSDLTVTLDPDGYVKRASRFTITATDAEDSPWKIYYKIDGVLFEKDWNEDAVFQLNEIWGYAPGPHIIEYWAVDLAGNEEVHHLETYVLDVDGPEVDLAFSGIHEVTLDNIDQITPETLIEINAVDDRCGVDRIEYRLGEDGELMLYEGPFTLPDGYYDLFIVAHDRLDNVGEKHYMIQVGGGEPATFCDLSPAEPTGENGWYVTPVTVSLEATDDASGVSHTLYKIDNGNWNTYTGPFVIDSDGAHTVYYYSVDNAGNEEGVKTRQVNIDFYGPTITIQKPANYIYLFDRPILPWIGYRPVVIGSISVTATVVDTATSGIQNVELYVNNQLKGTYSGNVVYTLDEPSFGETVIKVVAKDIAGNTQTQTIRALIYNW